VAAWIRGEYLALSILSAIIGPPFCLVVSCRIIFPELLVNSDLMQMKKKKIPKFF
jgi:hypothetical protein